MTITYTGTSLKGCPLSFPSVTKTIVFTIEVVEVVVGVRVVLVMCSVVGGNIFHECPQVRDKIRSVVGKFYP